MAVAFDAVGPSSAGTNNDLTSLTWSHTCGASATCLVVGVALGATTSDATATTTVTYNGSAMTSQGKIHNGGGSVGYVELFTLMNPPTGSALTVAVTRSGGTGTVTIIGGSVSYSGVASVAHATTAASAGAQASKAITITSAVGNMVTCVSGAGNIFVATTGGTNRWRDNANLNSGGGNGQMDDAAGASSVTLTINPNAADFIGAVGVDLVASGGTSAPLNPVLPGQTWRRYFQHHQQTLPPAPPAAVAAPIFVPPTQPARRILPLRWTRRGAQVTPGSPTLIPSPVRRTRAQVPLPRRTRGAQVPLAQAGPPQVVPRRTVLRLTLRRSGVWQVIPVPPVIPPPPTPPVPVAHRLAPVLPVRRGRIAAVTPVPPVVVVVPFVPQPVLARRTTPRLVKGHGAQVTPVAVVVAVSAFVPTPVRARVLVVRPQRRTRGASTPLSAPTAPPMARRAQRRPVTPRRGAITSTPRASITSFTGSAAGSFSFSGVATPNRGTHGLLIMFRMPF